MWQSSHPTCYVCLNRKPLLTLSPVLLFSLLTIDGDEDENNAVNDRIEAKDEPILSRPQQIGHQEVSTTEQYV